MQVRSGRRLSPPRAPPAPRGQRRNLPSSPRRDGGDVEEEDRISSLPDDLLLDVLARLRWRQAARTSVLARRWRGLWTRLPALSFLYDTLHVIEATLAQVSRPSLNDLHMVVALNGETAGRVSSLLRDIDERLAPKKLSIYFQGRVEGNEKIELPCFRSIPTLRFCCYPGLFALPPTGSKFEGLTRLELDRCTYLADLVPMCPSLRFLVVNGSYVGDVIIHSPSLEELYVDTTPDERDYLSVIDIRAPVLEKAMFDFQAKSDLCVSFSAPMVKQINWWHRNTGYYGYEDCMVRFSFMDLDYSLRSGVHKLSMLMFYLDDLSEVEDLSFPQKIPQLPLLPHHLSVLKLELDMNGHAFAPLVLHVLQIQPVTAALDVEVELTHARQIGAQCPVGCPCEQVNSNWRNENIKLTDLEAVTLVGFKGHDEEVDFLKVLFRCATVLKSMTVKVSGEGYKKISNICEQYPYVKCYVYLA